MRSWGRAFNRLIPRRAQGMCVTARRTSLRRGPTSAIALGWGSKRACAAVWNTTERNIGSGPASQERRLDAPARTGTWRTLREGSMWFAASLLLKCVDALQPRKELHWEDRIV